MKKMSLDKLVWCALGALCLLQPVAAQAPQYPEKPVRMVVAFSPGGGTDIVARRLSAKLTELLGQQFIVENRAGAGGVIGTTQVVRSPADGYTTLMATMGNLVVNPYIYDMPVDVNKDLAPVSKVVEVEFALLVHPSIPAANLKEFIDYVKSKPGEVSYSSSGIGGGPHLAGALFELTSGTSMMHVPYKGSGESLKDVVGGQVNATFDSLLQALPLIKEGRLKALAVLGGHRSALLPEVPTMAEAGLADYEFTNWYGLTIPSATPAPIVNTLSETVRAALADPTLRKQIEDMGARPVGDTPDEFRQFIQKESKKWEYVVKAADIKLKK